MSDLRGLQAAVDTLADVFRGGYLADDVGSSFTCTEAEALATVLRIGGHDAVADAWIAGHAEGDDQGDLHFLWCTAVHGCVLKDHHGGEHEVCEDKRPDDDPEPGDRCKGCGRDLTWVGPGMSDWEHVR